MLLQSINQSISHLKNELSLSGQQIRIFEDGISHIGVAEYSVLLDLSRIVLCIVYLHFEEAFCLHTFSKRSKKNIYLTPNMKALCRQETSRTICQSTLWTTIE